MEHFEYCYLVFRAHEVRRLQESAKAEGEEFYPVNSFTPLQCRLLAQAVIRGINPGEPDVLILRLRHPETDTDWLPVVRAAQSKFFDSDYTVVSEVLSCDGIVEHLAYSSSIPELVKPSASASQQK